MDPKDFQVHLDVRLDRLEGKLDDHLQRLSKAEADIGWIKSAGRYLTIVILGVIGKLAHLTFIGK